MVNKDVELYIKVIQSKYKGFQFTSEGVLSHEGNVLLTFNSDGSIFVSSKLSCDQFGASYLRVLEDCIHTSSVGNFSIDGEMVAKGGFVVISDMHYASLYANAEGYLVKCNKYHWDLASLDACLGVCSTVPWSVTEGMLVSLLTG